MSNIVFSDDGIRIGTTEDDIENDISQYEKEMYQKTADKPIRFTPSESYSMTEIIEQISNNINDILTNWKVVQSVMDGCDSYGFLYWVSCHNGWEGRSYELSTYILDDLMSYFQNLIELNTNNMLKSKDDEEFKINSDIYKFMNRNSYRLHSITSQDFMNYLTK